MPGLSYIPTIFRSQWLVTPPLPKTSFRDQTIIVTGSNTGIGLAAAQHIALLGASRLILAVRNLDKGAAAKTMIEKAVAAQGPAAGNTGLVIDVWQLDMQSYESVRSFAAKAATLPRLDGVVENAGISATKFSAAEGQEATITVNVISTLLLGLLLLPTLKATTLKHNTTPHLSIVSSEVHFFASFPERNSPSIFSALAEEKSFKFGERYWTSKLLLILLLQHLCTHILPADYPVVINSVNPGLCRSELMREMTWATRIGFFIFGARTTEVGARTEVHGVQAGRASHGKYLSDCKVAKTAPFVGSKEGSEVGERAWGELKAIMVEVQPGILGAL